MIIESNTRALVLLNLLNSLRKRDKMLGKPRILSFSPTRSINSIKHEHSCKILYLSNIEHDVTTSKIPFLLFLPRDCMLRYVFKSFFMYARPIPLQTKVHFKNLQFLAVTYDKGVLSCVFDVVKTVVVFSFV